MTAAVCILIVILVFAGDLWIKNRIEKSDVDKREKKLLGGRILIRKHHNRGAVLNLGQERRTLVAALSLVLTAALAVVFLVSLGHKGNRLLRVGLALLLGGAFSNTYDRMRRKHVVDYLSFGVRWKKLERVVFNLSDFCIMIGALLAVLGAS